MDFKKPVFIRKSDFINYFTRPQDQWFYKEEDLEDYIKSKTQINNIDINDYDDADKHEYDSLEALRLKILNGEKIDDRDPKVYEGKLIDKTSREYIKMKYIRLNVYDFDELYKDIHNLKYLANETKKYLEKDNFILFQPVFIFKDKAITRPDVFIKEKGKYTLIEVKATSKPKSKHLVDMIYQHNIISHVLSERDDFIDDYLLCVIKYAKGEKGKVNFDLTEHIPLVKAGKELGKKDSARFPEQLKYSDEAIEARRLARLDNDSEVTIKNLMQGHVSALENRNKGVYETHVAKLLDTKYFEKIIDELQAWTPMHEPSLLPDVEHFTTWFDDYSLLSLIKKYYFNNDKFLPLQWSGHVLPIKSGVNAYLSQEANNDASLRSYMIGINPLYARFFNDFQNTLCAPFNSGTYRIKETKELFGKLKTNKVYFDFESINPATCVIDDTVPYQQIVTQVSIIKNNEPVINIVNDPKNINISNMEEIVDAIYSGKDLSYVVYNKSFEVSRLKEMAALINKPEYYERVKTINENIFDLADFFDSRKDLITIRNLKGYYSIKNLLPIIEREAPHLFEKSKSINYHSLNGIHQGSEALNQTSRRFFGLIDDNEWKNIVNQLKAYCENDVRAMIAVDYYIQSILGSR